MEVVWIKKDARLHDHGPMAAACGSGLPFCIVYMYEPDQLSHKTVHGSHVLFANEGLADLDAQLRDLADVADATVPQQPPLPCLTCMEGEATAVLARLHGIAPIKRLLSHQETGTFASYERDKRVRRWCKANGVPWKEFVQTGVTRALRDRDDFTKNFNAFMQKPLHPVPTRAALSRLLRNLPSTGLIGPDKLAAVRPDHAQDRAERQRGGERRALDLFASFLSTRAEGYSRGISSPLSAWTSCSRLSPYLTFGHISMRRILQSLAARQKGLRERKAKGQAQSDGFLKSLANFQSRLRWRSHFVQKLESEPEMEHRAQCLAYDELRAAPGDWNPGFYAAWCEGRTGFPLVDACMRCLERHGWLNFRMRAMVVSFATYNLWLDWKGIAPHLARVFLDYEPGIHYPQLQMQAGTTGINAMRVYSVTKQAKDQDPTGEFIRKYVPELARVPDKFIHEPSKMPASVQLQCGVHIGQGAAASSAAGGPLTAHFHSYYPTPIVDEQATAKQAKARVAAIKKQGSTKQMANAVYLKHGSRKALGSASGGSGSGSGSGREQFKALQLSEETPRNSSASGGGGRDAGGRKRSRGAQSCALDPSVRSRVGGWPPHSMVYSRPLQTSSHRCRPKRGRLRSSAQTRSGPRCPHAGNRRRL